MNKRPNIVFYFADQQRADTLGCYGQRLPVSPVLDRMAEEGVLFENAYTVQPVCGPARAVLQSGRYATETGCYRNGIHLPTNITTLADCFHRAGYETAYVGKWHLASDKEGCDLRTFPIPPDRRGGYRDYWMAADVLEFTSHGYNGFVFDGNGDRVNFTGYRADCINNFAVDYVSRKKDKPFLLFISQLEPHHQNDRDKFEGPYGSRKRFGDFDPPADLEPLGGNWREEMPGYLGSCHSLDENVGRLIDVLKEQGLYEDTIIVYTSDHGCHFRTRPGEYKRSCHDASIHVPLIIHGPGFTGGKRVEHFVSLLDLPATLLAAAGIEKPQEFRGRDLRALAEGSAQDWEDEIFIQISEHQTGRALRIPHWTYSVRAADGELNAWTDTFYEDFLYDNDADPGQHHNLVNDPAYEELRAQLRERLLIRMKEAGEELPQILPASMRPNKGKEEV